MLVQRIKGLRRNVTQTNLFSVHRLGVVVLVRHGDIMKNICEILEARINFDKCRIEGLHFGEATLCFIQLHLLIRKVQTKLVKTLLLDIGWTY